jgi:hypothetical protein
VLLLAEDMGEAKTMFAGVPTMGGQLFIYSFKVRLVFLTILTPSYGIGIGEGPFNSLIHN